MCTFIFSSLERAIELKIEQCQFWLYEATLIFRWIDDVSQLLSLGKLISALKELNKK